MFCLFRRSQFTMSFKLLYRWHLHASFDGGLLAVQIGPLVLEWEPNA